MNAWEPKHYMLLSGFLGALAIQIGGLQHGWRDVLSPTFIAGVLMQVSTLVGAMYSGAPGKISIQADMPAAGNVKVDGDSIKNPSRFGSWLLILILTGSSVMTFSGCAATVQPVDRSPQAARAQQAGEVIQRIGEFQQAVIDGQQLGKVKTEDARVIVTWTVATIRRLKEAPAGWAVVALAGWQDVRPVLLRDPTLSVWVGVVDELLRGGL